MYHFKYILILVLLLLGCTTTPYSINDEIDDVYKDIDGYGYIDYYGTNCNVRAEASVKSSVIGSGKSGQKVWIEYYDEKWFEVTTKNADIGYVHITCF